MLKHTSQNIAHKRLLFYSFLLSTLLTVQQGLHPNLAWPEDTIQVYFSPDGGAREALTECFETAHGEIVVAMYIFSNAELADALVEASRRGVRVRVLLDGSEDQEAFSQGRYLSGKGVFIRVDRSHMISAEQSQGIMHNKFAVIDDSTVITGSYNWTQSAEVQNDENLLILRGSPHLAGRYKAEFEKLWERGVSYDVKQLAAPLVLSASDVPLLRKHAGEIAYVCGAVHDVYFSKRSGTYFINFGPDRSGFTGVIFKSAAVKFAEKGINPADYEKKKVEIYGKIIDHPRYGLEIIIEDPNQLNVISDN